MNTIAPPKALNFHMVIYITLPLLCALFETLLKICVYKLILRQLPLTMPSTAPNTAIRVSHSVSRKRCVRDRIGQQSDPLV